jgi:NAD dependent epimerase/dehydratase family enzyme
MLLFLHRQLVFMEQLMGKKFVLKLTFWGDDLGLTCQKWAAADQFEKLGIRTVKIRTGLVLGKMMVF